MTIKPWFTTFTVRSVIILFWFCISIGFLLLPLVPKFSQEKKSITVLAWPTIIDADQLVQFEKETGIKVNLRYFENNEELYAKVKESGGIGYDLIMPSDYLLEELIKQNLVKKLDRTKINFFEKIHPQLIGKYFDPANDYSVPFLWNIYGLAIDKDYFGGTLPKSSWALIFDEAYLQPHTCMIDDSRELIMIAAQYLYGSYENLTQKQFDEISALLKKQKKYVEMYTEERGNYMLASKASPVALIFSSIIGRMMRAHSHIAFMIPDEGSFMVIDSFVMTKTTKKDDYVYAFLNYLYRADVLKENVQQYGFFAPIHDPELDALNTTIPFPTDEQFKKLEFFRNVLPKKEVSDIWIALKAAY